MAWLILLFLRPPRIVRIAARVILIIIVVAVVLNALGLLPSPTKGPAHRHVQSNQNHRSGLDAKTSSAR